MSVYISPHLALYSAFFIDYMKRLLELVGGEHKALSSSAKFITPHFLGILGTQSSLN